MFEYLKKTFKSKTSNELLDLLNEYGQKNWEVIDYEEKKEKYNKSTYNVLFKRKINDKNDKNLLLS